MTKKFTLLLIGIFFTFIFSSCYKDLLNPSSVIVQEELFLFDFSSIEIEGQFNLFLTRTNDEKIIIETNENVLPYIEYYTIGNRTLGFRLQRGTSFRKNITLNLYISAKNLNALTASNGGHIILENTLFSNVLNIDLSGGSSCEGKLNTNKLYIISSGGSYLNIWGNTKWGTMELSGGSECQNFGLLVSDLNMDISGGAYAEITATDRLIINASGGSTVIYKGNPLYKDFYPSGGSTIESYYQ